MAVGAASIGGVMSITILVLLQDDELEFAYDEDGVLCYFDEESDDWVEDTDVDYDDAGYAYYFNDELEVWLYFDDEEDAWLEFDVAA